MPAWPLSELVRRAAASPSGRLTRHLHPLLFGRAFRGNRAHRLLILFQPNRISYASSYPFLHYAEEFAAHFETEIRFLPVEQAIARGVPPGLANPTHILAQAWLTDPPEKHAALDRLYRSLPQDAVRAFSDTFANADIRLAAALPGIHLYFKKSLFLDSEAFLRPTYGHTNLTEYYGRLYGLEDKMKDWKVPPSALGKLRIAPNFLTDPGLLRIFLDSALPPTAGRRIDLHARLGGTDKPGWYGEMRRRADTAARALGGLAIATGTGISRGEFMDEMRQSKVCFSPFGYGELCWRDIEAMAAGAVLLKPDMSHLRTEPDLFRDGETYVACRWDFADVDDKVRALLADEDRRTAIATRAWEVARAYLAGGGPVETYAALFVPKAAAAA